MENPHMVKQTITYSDGTETVINYRGQIVNGILIPDFPEEKVEPETTEEAEKSAPSEEISE